MQVDLGCLEEFGICYVLEEGKPFEQKGHSEKDSCSVKGSVDTDGFNVKRPTGSMRRSSGRARSGMLRTTLLNDAFREISPSRAWRREKADCFDGGRAEERQPHPL